MIFEKLSSLKIRDQLLMAFGVVLFFLLAIIFTNVWMVDRIGGQTAFVEKDAFAQTLFIYDLEKKVIEATLRLEADIAAGTRSNQRLIATLRKTMTQRLEEGKVMFRNNQETLAALVRIEEGLDTLNRSGQVYLQATLDQNWAEIGTLMEDYRGLSEQLAASIDLLQTMGVANLRTAMGTIDHLGKRMKWISIATGFTALALSMVILFLLNRALMKPVRMISDVMHRAEKGDLTAVYGNRNLVRCWETLHCGKTECSAYEASNLRCWQISGTHCQGQVQGDMAMKLGSCEKCTVYQKAQTNEFTIIGEGLNNLLAGIAGAYRQFRTAMGEILEASDHLSKASKSMKDGNEAQTMSLAKANRSISEMDSSIGEVTETVESYMVTNEKSSSSILEMSSSISEVASSAENLSQIVERTTSAIEQLFTSIKSTASGVEVLSGDVTNISGGITEITASVKESADSARTVQNMSSEVSQGVVQESKKAVSRAIEGIENIRSVVEKSHKIILNLGEKSQDIGKILKIIQDVSDQTNLLALNAAIIAAQAGEQGKGFSVVAEEVRELSERTASSAKEIGGLISSMQRGLEEAVESMNKGSSRVEEGIELIDDVDGKLKKVETATAKSLDASNFIVRLTSEQSKATNQISTSVTNISEKSQEIASTAKQQAASCDELARSVTEITAMMHEMNRATEEQSRTATQISLSAQSSNEVVQRITKAARQETKESKSIVQAMQSVEEVARENLTVVKDLESLVISLRDRASALDEEISRVKLPEGLGNVSMTGAPIKKKPLAVAS